MARLRSLLCASLLAAAHAAAETATCSDPLAASALPTPIVDAKALSDQARGQQRARWLRAHARVPRTVQIMKLSYISEAESPAVTRVVYTPQDMEARECVAVRRASRFSAALTPRACCLPAAGT